MEASCGGGAAVNMRGLQLVDRHVPSTPAWHLLPRRHPPANEGQWSGLDPYADPCTSCRSLALVVACPHKSLDMFLFSFWCPVPLRLLGGLSCQCEMGAKEVLQSHIERTKPRYLSVLAGQIVGSQVPGADIWTRGCVNGYQPMRLGMVQWEGA